VRARYILVRNPKEAKRQKAKRDKIIAELEQELSHLKNLPEAEHTKAVCVLVSHPTYGRYLTNTRKGKPRINKAKICEEERYDGKYLLRTPDDTLSPEDVALGYKQLVDVERAFRTLKSELDIRPVYHRLEDRIRAHVVLCWLALLLVRVIETRTEKTWSKIRSCRGCIWSRSRRIKDALCKGRKLPGTSSRFSPL
jgi:transposase